MAVPSPSSPLRVPLLAAIAIVIGNMVGTGVFTSLGFQVAAIPSGFPVLLLWLIGGLLSFCGAVNYAELTAAFPRSGGEYQLLSRVYHPGVGFVSGWISMIVGFPAPVAAAALVIGDYACLMSGGEPGLISRLVAAGVIITVTGAHLVSVVFSGKFQWVATGLKLVLILTVSVCGFFLADAQPVRFLPQAGDGGLIAQPAFVTSLIYVLYAYCGWNAACYIAGEVANPERNVPRALLTGTAVVTVLYIAVNAAMLHATPIAAMAGREDVAFIAAHHIFGSAGGNIMAGLIAFGLISTISAMTWAGPRVAQQMGRDYPMLDFLARTDARGVPWVASLLQCALALLFAVFTPDVEKIVTRTTFLLELVLLLTVWGVVHLRVRQPDLPRPCRAWGYPYTTILFLVVVAFTLAIILKERPEDSRWGMIILLVGVVLFFFAKPQRREE